MPRAAKAKALLTVFLLTGTVLFLVFGVTAMTEGVGREETKDAPNGGLAAGGCSCHNADGPFDNVTINHTVPSVFEAGKTYSIWVNFSGGTPMNPAPNTYKGGFNVLVTAGKLAPAAEAPQSGFTHVVENSGDLEITHTQDGDRDAARSFNFQWTAPASGNGATFVITVNSVNGDALPSELDFWNRVTVSSILKGQVPETSVGGGGHAETAVHHLGIRSLAYWIGVVSFAVLFIIYGATFFLFKYGESNATTDHHDRPEAAAATDFTGAPIRQSKLVVLLLVAALATILVLVLLYQRGLFNA